MGAWIETVLLCQLLCLILSHPAWVRGLKLARMVKLAALLLVAPCVGAWIETILALRQAEAFQRRTLRGCVD